MPLRSLTLVGRLRSVACAVRGIGEMVRSQPNARIHAGATVSAVLLGLTLRISIAEWCWIVLAIVGVWTAEALNTALESLTDIASPGVHPVAGKAKDIAAGAVLIAAVGSAVIGLLVFGPHIWQWWQRLGTA